MAAESLPFDTPNCLLRGHVGLSQAGPMSGVLGLIVKIEHTNTYVLTPDGQRSRWAVCGQRRAEQPVVHLGVEGREALPVRGEDVGGGVLDLDDETLELEPAKVVAAAALGVGG